jgi:hypothetical protein
MVAWVRSERPEHRLADIGVNALHANDCIIRGETAGF